MSRFLLPLRWPDKYPYPRFFVHEEPHLWQIPLFGKMLWQGGKVSKLYLPVYPECVKAFLRVHAGQWRPFHTRNKYYSATSLCIVPVSFRSIPKMILRLFFGTHTLWYLHSHTVYAELLFTLYSFLTDQPPKQPRGRPKKGVSFFKYFSIDFAILSGLTGGSLAINLDSYFRRCCYSYSKKVWKN